MVFFYFLVNLFLKKMDKPVGFGIGSDRCAVHGVVAIRCDRYDNFIYTRYFQQLIKIRDPVENGGRRDERTLVSSSWVARHAGC